MNTLRRLLPFLTILSFGHILGATDVQLSGNFGYQVSGSQVTITVDRVENVTDNTTSGTLQLSLWATSSPYNGGGISGYSIGEYQFNDVLGPGQYFFDISRTVAYDAPPDGTYYLSMILAEWSGSAFEIIDSGSFSGTEIFGSTTPTPTDPSGIPGSTSNGGDWYSNPIIGNFTPLGGGWSYSDWFGSFYYAGASWFYRPGFDWTYVSGGSAATTSWWIYVNNSNDWCWTNSSFYPSIFSTSANTWLWFDDSVSDFWNPDAGSYVGDSGSGSGGTGGSVYTVDYILTNTGGLSQASWNEFTQTYSNILNQSGYTNYYQYSSTSNQLILRFDADSADAAAQLRASLQSLVGDYGGFRIDVE